MPKKFEYLILFILLACAVAVRLPAVWEYYYHNDELIHSFIAQGGTWVDVFFRGMNEVHPPLGHFLRHYLFYFDDGIVFARLVSVLFGILSALVLFSIGKKISKDTYLGLIFVGMLAFSSIAVTYTIQIRNYSFFLFFSLLSYYFYLCLFEAPSKKVLLLYVGTSFLSCATHFSGYIFTGSLSASLAYSLLSKGRVRETVNLSLCHLGHLAMLLVIGYFYFFRSSIGSSWYNFYLNLEPFPVLRENTFLEGGLSLYAGFFVLDPRFAVMLIALSLFGFICLCFNSRAVALSVVFVFISQVFLFAFSLYPLVGNRYCFYLFPFFVFVIGKGLDEMLSLSIIPKKVGLSTIAVLAILFSVGLLQRNSYFEDNYEFTTSNQSFSLAEGFLKSNTVPGDIILTNKGSWLHLLYPRDKRNTGYFSEPLGKMDYDSRDLYFLEKRNFWEYIIKDTFYTFLEMVKVNFNTEAHYWFANIGTSDYSIGSIYHCEKVKPFIESSHKGRSVLIFRLNKEFVLENFHPGSQLLEECFEASEQPHIGGVF